MPDITIGLNGHSSLSRGNLGTVINRLLEFSHIITNGVPSSKEFFDIRERRNSFVHVLPDNSFSAQITWPNASTTSGTQADSYINPHATSLYSRIMTYMIGVLLSPL